MRARERDRRRESIRSCTDHDGIIAAIHDLRWLKKYGLARDERQEESGASDQLSVCSRGTRVVVAIAVVHCDDVVEPRRQ